jgi:ribosomal-protein-alanine N-acetyltransferase
MENVVEGALLVQSDESPVAWVRLAAVSDRLDVGPWLDISLPLILAHLGTVQVWELAWLDHDKWAGPFLESRGFCKRAEVITLAKTDRETPDVRAPSITVRPATHADTDTIALIDQMAFAPTWWRSEATIRRRAATSSRFTLAERRSNVLGYAETELHLPTAHLNRIAVNPDYQGQEVGALLLKQVLESVWQSGAKTVSLNTQRSNRRSRRLYDRFGFQPTGDSATVWGLRLWHQAPDTQKEDR